ncbi:MAG: NifB/NifX family molybdenum-iron cluster-binding protein [Candidatus Nanoarchaeia archaeon]|nr:NifB/NifX family molybdenum-iron cluster-binding protein [Candidatus Nanoarchaeia archaeon]
MKMLVAINENNEMNSRLSEHFGHCPYFAIYDIENQTINIVKNEIDHSNEMLTPVDQVMKYNPEIVFTLGIGQKAINLFKERNVILKTGNFQTLKEVIENINSLNNISSGCEH